MCSDSSSCFNRMYLQMCVSCDLISKHNFSSADADLWVEGKRLGVIGVNDWWVGLKDDALTGRLESSSTHSHQQVHHLGRKGILCLYLMPFLTHFQGNMTQEPASVSIITNQKWTSSQLPLQSCVSAKRNLWETTMNRCRSKKIQIIYYISVVTSAPVATSSAAPDITPRV